VNERRIEAVSLTVQPLIRFLLSTFLGAVMSFSMKGRSPRDPCYAGVAKDNPNPGKYFAAKSFVHDPILYPRLLGPLMGLHRGNLIFGVRSRRVAMQRVIRYRNI